MKNSLVILFTALTCAATNLAAQSMAYVIPTNLAGVTAAAEPPAWLNPLTATDGDLAMYGYPPRPNPEMQSARFQSWQKAMAQSKHFVLPNLSITNKVHGPTHTVQARSPTQPPADSGTTNAFESSNWSAVVVPSGASSFSTNSFHSVAAEYVVPVASQGPGVCNAGTDYSSSWVGIDGSGSPDVLQAGTESDASCGLQSYYAWYEWYPQSEVQIGGFAVSPGDDIWIEVWNTSPTQGYAYIVNESTGQALNLSFVAPSGTQLVGNTAEWVVERPTINGSYATLAVYASDYFSNCYADTYSGVEYTPGSASAQLVTMLANNSAPTSYPTLLGANAIQFQWELPVKKAIF